MAKEQSVVLVKPDGLQRGLLGEMVSRFERKGLKLVAVKMMRLTDEILDHWYEHHKDKDFFDELKSFMKSAPIVAMLWQGVEAVAVVRKLCGTTSGREAEAGSIRGDFSISQQLNLIHASDSVDNAARERKLIFKDGEIIDWESAAEALVYSAAERG
ncbi:TPA: nucleoside-diphosphate kinase [Candidatus Beckwithbacteria bacterium]|nr:MAG: nucleoside-diphosphate kinase [Candidatus Beckwithbacteria bacterium RIFOXYD1_FULL_50_11]HAV66730.1 nucleoside-diphosphate kinase [Candidatus Beckwithbacteria bacterium]